ncbi:MAG: hypothetical protein GY699_06065 [Desulfobacteraceae bacterium]|nr:hypothetical protein [Desulfobacteraceae bacterium]
MNSLPFLIKNTCIQGLIYLTFLIVLFCPALVFSASQLEGSWSSVDNSNVIFKGNQYQLSEYGQIVDKGTFSVQGNILTTKSQVSGMADQYAFECQNNSLSLRDNYGQFYQFNRSTATNTIKHPQQQQGVNGPNTPTQITQFLSGRWKDIRSSGHTIIEIHSNGTFAYYSDSTASGNYSNQYGKTGSWGYGNQNNLQGRWQANGTPQRGTIFYQSPNGEKGTLNYKVMVENGNVYRNECYFDGTLYQRQ